MSPQLLKNDGHDPPTSLVLETVALVVVNTVVIEKVTMTWRLPHFTRSVLRIPFEGATTTLLVALTVLMFTSCKPEIIVVNSPDLPN